MKICCLGDSLTAGYGVRPENCWVSLLNHRTSYTWINCGIPGDTSLGMLTRLRTDILPQKPDYVIWLGGFNDILLTGSDHQAKSCVMAFVNHCVAAGVKPVIGIPYEIRAVAAPWNRLCDWEVCRPVLEGYISWLHRLTEAAMLRRVDFRETAFSLQSDGMHPSEEGHRRMAEAVLGCACFKEGAV